jgi:hypothetical protein
MRIKYFILAILSLSLFVACDSNENTLESACSDDLGNSLCKGYKFWCNEGECECLPGHTDVLRMCVRHDYDEVYAGAPGMESYFHGIDTFALYWVSSPNELWIRSAMGQNGGGSFLPYVGSSGDTIIRNALYDSISTASPVNLYMGSLVPFKDSLYRMTHYTTLQLKRYHNNPDTIFATARSVENTYERKDLIPPVHFTLFRVKK